MNVEDGLPGVLPGVEHQPVAGLGQALGRGHRPGVPQQLGGQRRVTRSELGGGRVGVRLRDDHEVGRRLRGDVTEGEGALGLAHDRRRDLTAQDRAENTTGLEGCIRVARFPRCGDLLSHVRVLSVQSPRSPGFW